ncbi:MAG: alpha/beta hydrolase [SAR202 cluster bacterium Io17-Chloro-G4]|nr:MAG: alpha/beta hydrolase [SAR202 cluster bacterium Io17-Chloro-G4]
MAITPQLEAVKQMFISMGERSKELGTIDGFRLALEETISQFPLAGDVVYEGINAGGVAAEWIFVEGKSGQEKHGGIANGNVVLYLHGGGYVIGSMRAYRGFLSRVSRATGAKVLGLNYRLAPEFPFPAAVDDSVAAYRWLLSQGINPSNIVIGGDSAGGGLTVATLVALRYLGEPMPAAGVCISPWVDLEGTGESMTSKAEIDPIVQKEALEFMAQLYMGERDRRAPLAAPLHADLRGLPPLLIQVGTAETLLDDSTRLADKAKSSGVKVELDIWEDMIHVWPIFAPVLPEGQQAIERIGEFVRKQTKSH